MDGTLQDCKVSSVFCNLIRWQRVFFLPLGMAALHIAMAFSMVKGLLALFSMTNSGLFAGCTVVTILVFAGIYGIIYGLTARLYYKIVERR